MDNYPLELVACPRCTRWIEPAGWCRCGYATAAQPTGAAAIIQTCAKCGEQLKTGVRTAHHCEPAPQPKPAAGRRMVYIAGPISKGDLCENINQANRAFRVLALAGLSPLVPHWSAFSGGAMVAPTSGAVYALATSAGCDLPHETWIAIDLAFVERSDALLRLPGESKGADMEVAHARARGIPVFGSVAEVLVWAGVGMNG